MKLLRKLNVEALEAREMPALFGNPWPNAGGLTMSFAPDGTTPGADTQGHLSPSEPSTLFKEMGPLKDWQTEILRAFQTWAVNANINIGLVPDAGSPFGPESLAPGAGSTGQIRIGAFGLGASVVALNQPYNPLSGASSGDLLLNDDGRFSIGAQVGKFDVYSVALNEAGNIFGLADTSDPSSALYGHYLGVRTGLVASDIAALQTLYGGARTRDAFDVTASNDSINNPTVLTAYASPTDSTKKMVSALDADLTTLSDVDHYEFKVTGTSITVRLGTVGKSLLNAKVSVYDSNDNFIATATSAGPQAMQDLVLTVNGLTSGKLYTVKVEKAGNDVFGIGKYDLKVGYGFDPVSAATTTSTSYTSDSGTNNTTATATTLAAVAGSANKLYEVNATIESTADVDFYKFTSPSSVPKPLTITVTPEQAYGLYTRVTVYDANRTPVDSEVLVNGPDGRLVIQVANPVPSKAYFVKVEGVGRNGAGLTGNYTLNVDFTRAAVPLSTVATSTLTAATDTSYTTFSVPEAKVFHFALGATSTDASVASGVRMIVYNASYQIVATLTAGAGSTTSGAILLDAGTYYFKFKAATKTGAPLPNLTYALRAAVLSDPIDPYAPADPTNPPPPPPPYTTTPYTGAPLTDPYTNPWTP